MSRLNNKRAEHLVRLVNQTNHTDSTKILYKKINTIIFLLLIGIGIILIKYYTN